MLAVNYTNLRENMKNYMDKVTDDYETMIVTRKNNQKCGDDVGKNLQQSYGKSLSYGRSLQIMTGLWNQRNSCRKEKQVFIS